MTTLLQIDPPTVFSHPHLPSSAKLQARTERSTNTQHGNHLNIVPQTIVKKILCPIYFTPRAKRTCCFPSLTLSCSMKTQNNHQGDEVNCGVQEAMGGLVKCFCLVQPLLPVVSAISQDTPHKQDNIKEYILEILILIGNSRQLTLDKIQSLRFFFSNYNQQI